jgi:hypothetical protein
MKPITIKQLNNLLILIVLALSMQACGGGSDGEDTEQTSLASSSEEPVLEAPSYEPSAELLTLEAERSTDIYVEETFNFNTYKTVTFDVSATKNDGTPLANTLLFVYAIPSEVQELAELKPEDKDLLFIVKTNSAGLALVTQEVNQNLDSLLLELQTIGIENQIVKKLTEQNLVLHHF